MKNSQHLGFWLLVAIMGFFAGPLLRSGVGMEQHLRTEVAATRGAMGERLTQNVLSVAAGMFDSGAMAMLTGSLAGAQHSRSQQRLGEQVAGPGGAAMSSMYNSYLQGLILQSYVATMRAAVVLFWLGALAPMLAASIYDGLMQRQVKWAEFGSLRPATFTLAGMVVIPMMALPLLYVTAPFSMSPLLVPVWAACASLPLALLIANSQPLFGK